MWDDLIARINSLEANGSLVDADGRPTAYGLYMQTSIIDDQEQHPEKKANFVLSITNAERWKTMSDEEKAPYVKMAECGKEGYVLIHQARYWKTFCDEVKHKRGKKQKENVDPKAVESPLPALVLFGKDEKERAKAQHRRGWPVLDQESRARYKAKAAKEKVCYEKELRECRGKLTAEWREPFAVRSNRNDAGKEEGEKGCEQGTSAQKKLNCSSGSDDDTEVEVDEE